MWHVLVAPCRLHTVNRKCVCDRRLYVGDNELRREAVPGTAEQRSDRRGRAR